MTTDTEEESSRAPTDKQPDPVATMAPIVGKKWHTVVIHRLLQHGPLGFNELERSIDGISAKVLSSCLDDLETRGVVNRRIVNEKPFRVEYSLTDLGHSLEPVITAMEGWGSEQIARADSPEDAVLRVPR